ncbi:LysR family transcriptional regulator [Noviherbaspirillum pedocola]|uniref:LysR family transcriptional regulator n=1 Tax=Noviherbaspirillum pedocola TaxID=2801341 RepID=A0A934SXE5_9BURK|nr:LysR family transcriptional regulator [Noviherbaspirillum pedocola]MBK4737105.1 LysR family transcriptional regulator [Noviherbaspirillum pedocola]
MDFTQLRAFVTVANEGNLTRAAERLHLTQPAVTLQVKALQKNLGLQLFTRTASGMTLTADGVKLLPFAERVLASVSEFRQGVASLNSVLSGTLSIGTILDPEFIRLGAFLKRLVETHPKLSTQLQHGMSGTVAQRIRNGELDTGFYIGAPGKDFDCLVLTSFNYLVLAPQGWKTRVSHRSWDELAKLPWIWTPPESAHSRLLNKVLNSHRGLPHKVAMVDQEASMLDLVKSGVGLALVRESIAMREAHAHGLAIADSVALTTELSFICLARRRRETMIDAVFSLLGQVWQS